jgi:hypothetical protein
MTLADRPPFIVRWETGLSPEILQGIGKLAVISSQIEQLLHQIYWKYAGLRSEIGPVVTENLNPKRLSEDIIKFARRDPNKTNELADLRALLAEFESINVKRNQCIHWIWSIVGRNLDLKLSTEPPKVVPPYRISKPIYKQSGVDFVEFHAEELDALCNDCSWLRARLASHAIAESELRENRRHVSHQGSIDGLSFAYLFWPAPWLDKPLPQDSTPSDPRAARKSRSRRPRPSPP